MRFFVGFVICLDIIMRLSFVLRQCVFFVLLARFFFFCVVCVVLLIFDSPSVFVFVCCLY